ncbi:MAG: hypothetical protein QM778_13960 [Myxococcales bacterium]
MSAARIEQLKSLLARVQERKAAPRLRPLSTPVAVSSAAPAAVSVVPVNSEAAVAKTIQDLRQVTVSLPEPPAPVAPLTLDDVGPAAFEAAPAVVQAAPVAPPASAGATARSKAPTADDLLPTPSAPPVTSPASVAPVPAPISVAPVPPSAKEPPPAPAVKALEREPSVETLVGTPEPMFETAAAVEAPLTAPSARVEAPLLSRAEPVMKVVSSPRIEAPKNFGDLLEASLSLRPR